MSMHVWAWAETGCFPASWASDLAGLGADVLAHAPAYGAWVHGAVEPAPKGIIVWSASPSQALCTALQALDVTAPCPVLLFSADDSPACMDRALAAQVHAYVVNGYAPARLPVLWRLAQARFAQAQQQRKALRDLTTRWGERVQVNRAKGILMHTQHLSDDEAFKLLRSTSMGHSMRLGELAQQVIHAAHEAELVNRCGQLRMLSQRTVKLQFAVALGAPAPLVADEWSRTLARVTANLAWLAEHAAQPAHAPWLAAVQAAWAQVCPDGQTLTPAHATAPPHATWQAWAAAAGQLLATADDWAAAVEAANGRPPLGWLNKVARQRMLCQQYTQQVLHARLLGPEQGSAPSALAQATRSAFEDVLTTLNSLPIASPGIDAALAQAGADWLALVHAGQPLQAARLKAQRVLALGTVLPASEQVLASLEALTAAYESSLALLLG